MLISNYITPVMRVDPTGYLFWDVLDVVGFVSSMIDFIGDPTLANLCWLAMDTVGLLPLLPSMGTYIKGVKYFGKVDDVGDSTKGVSRINRFALGLDDYGLNDFAARNGAKTYKNFDPLDWRNTVLNKLSDPDIEVLVNLDGVDSPLAAVQRVARGSGGATDWELFQIKTNPQWWESIKWFENGVEVVNPFQ